jgi:glutathione peroxidase
VTLKEAYPDNFEIVAFPCNQFGGQEPGSNDEIKAFAKEKNYTGLLMDKIEVNGPNASPVYDFLKKGSGDPSDIPWNFEKFLVAKDGTVAGRYTRSRASASELSPKINELLTA